MPLQILLFIFSSIFSSLLAQETKALFLYPFENRESIARWTVFRGAIKLSPKAYQGKGSLEWNSQKRGSLGIGNISIDLRKGKNLEFWIYKEGSEPKTIQVLLKNSGSRFFWKKHTLEKEGWQHVSFPLYTFARKQGPSWKDIRGMTFFSYKEGVFCLDQFRVGMNASEKTALIEPDSLLLQRAFPGQKETKVFQNTFFRIATNVVDFDGDKLLSRLNELYKLFKITFSLKEDPDYPLTLVIFKEKESYVDFCRNTVQKIYGMEISPTRSDGRTFFDYCVSSYLEKHKEERPVYFHEITHQLVSKFLQFDVDQHWIQEGICTLFQREMLVKTEQDKIGKSVRRMISNKRWLPLVRLNPGYLPPTNQYLQMLTLVEFLLKGKYAVKFHLVLRSFQQRKSLKKVVADTLNISLVQFEKEWVDFCRQTYH